MSQQRQGRLMWAQGPRRWGRGRVWRRGKGQGSRQVCQKRGEQVGRGSEWKGEGEGKVGGRRSRGIDQGRGDPALVDPGNSKGGRRWREKNLFID